jgi:hypothetical protein
MIERLIRVADLHDDDAADVEDLVGMTVEERISRVEAIRRMHIHEDPTHGRLDRVLAVAHLAPRSRRRSG